MKRCTSVGMVASVALAVFVVSQVCFAQEGRGGAVGGTQAQERLTTETRVKGGIVTLYAVDPLASTLCFNDGKDGQVFQAGEVRNRCSHIDFNNYNKGALTAGIEGSQQGRIVDLGTADDLQGEYGYQETVIRGQGFASLRAMDKSVLIGRDRSSQNVQEVKEASRLFQTLEPKEARLRNNAPILLGHIYLTRIVDPHDRDFQILLKILVISYTPGESVTFRWERL